MRQKTALRRLQRLDRNGWHEISVEAQCVCQAASLARCRRSWEPAFLVEDSPARRRLLTREAPARASLAAQLQRARRAGNTGLP